MSDGDEERSEKASEKTMREKLERLERMIASLMESKACRSKGTGSCHGKKFKKEPQATIAEQPSGSETKSMSAAVGQRAPSTREGESVWSTLLNEVSFPQHSCSYAVEILIMEFDNRRSKSGSRG